LIGFFWGSRSSNFEFRAFSGSRPLSDRQIADAVLKSVTVGLILSSLLWAGFLALVTSIVAVRLGSPAFSRVGHVDLARFVGDFTISALVTWSIVSFITSLALAGKKAIGVALALVFSMWLGAVLLSVSVPRHAQTIVLQFYSWGWLALCLCGFAAAFFTTWLRGLLSIPAAVLAAAIVLAAVAGILLKQQSLDLLTFLLFCLLPIPLAAAPLAVFVNRHR
jgi:hypothetical protein